MSKSQTTIEIKDFSVLRDAITARFNEMLKQPVFEAAIDRDFIWELYLDSFPEGTNPIFRQRTEHDCSCCRNFVKNMGGAVNIVNGQIQTIWDVQVGGQYQPVVDTLAEYVRTTPIRNLCVKSEGSYGSTLTREMTNNGILEWSHFFLRIPNQIFAGKGNVGPKLSEYEAQFNVVLRSLREISDDAIDTVLDLIRSNSIYRGAEKLKLVETFKEMKANFPAPDAKAEKLYAWSQVAGPNNWACKIRNDVIGTLLVDLSEGTDLERAVKTFEDKVSGTNYKRPSALVTPKMKEAAKAKVEELGLMSALERRYAKLEDISINNVLFANRDSRRRITGDVFDEIDVKVAVKRDWSKVESIPIEKFIESVLPTARSIEVYFDNEHTSKLVSLIAPVDPEAKRLFKWDNLFSWSYTGDVADSIKERVKTAGGNVTGDVCCRLGWFNYDDLDLHMVEPQRSHIYYGARKSRITCGELDVDMNVSATTRTPVENIFYPKRDRMVQGTYTLYVHCYTKREAADPGFQVEVDILGEVHQFTCDRSVRQSEQVQVAKIEVKGSTIKIVPILDSKPIQREVWGLKTMTFQPVTAIMLSPNFWDDKEIGNKHYFFMLANCVNDGSARGFYNEFLNAELEPHRKTMELVGAKMRTEETKDQMSGLGFSSTQPASVVVKVKGAVERMFKLTF